MVGPDSKDSLALGNNEALANICYDTMAVNLLSSFYERRCPASWPVQ